MNDMALEVTALGAGYGSITVLRNVSVRIASSEIVTVLGPNGAGKTTLMRAIVGQIPVRSGTVRYNGADITGASPERNARRGLCMVPEGRGIFPRLTVGENLALGAYLRRDRKAWQAERDVQFERFPILAERQSAPAGTLSGGQQQMLAIVRALLASPQVLLLDEPSLGLAPAVVDEVLGIVAGLSDQGVSVLMVEQSVSKALAIADRGYMLAHGSIEASGSSGELQQHADALEAAYLGGWSGRSGSPVGR